MKKTVASMKKVALLLLGGTGVIAFIALYVIVLYVCVAFLHGLTLSYLWGWFIVPVFGLPVLSIPMATGVALTFWSLKKHRTLGTKDASWEKAWKDSISFLIQPLFALFFGWLIHWMIT